MTQISDAHLGKVAVVLLAGPLDGQRFKVPLMPPSKKVPNTLDLPLKQPASSSPFARYELSGDEPVGGHYAYFFLECRGPQGEQVLYAPVATDSVVGEQAGVLELASQAGPTA